MDEYDLFESQSESNLEKTQLELYLEEPILVRKGNENLDVLKFWKDNMIRYPELSMMARDVLSIPISTVASESTFSIEGRVIGKYESSILPENAEAKLCAQDWLYGHGDLYCRVFLKFQLRVICRFANLEELRKCCRRHGKRHLN
ncbi:zinc finger BED domain-containing protein DAYSLEEPER-like [Lycium ferocissimum]|uniref:zinc finger BED domain-containing protein DAYSLEEPER-like n=1 Tax=Lycium ferocissimum TaxID=112874 RepID=UPI002815CEB9|nr:zinc finger BED domain-containing protein DAYSLEEPER-like [Lycium ferocissimum]